VKTTFIAVRNGMRADGFLVVGAQMFEARSGRNISDIQPQRLADDRKKNKAEPSHFGFDDERGDIPPGEYLLGQGTHLTTTNYKTMSPSPTRNTAPGGAQYKKFPILGTDSTRLGNGLRDTRYGNAARDARTDILFHYDGDVEGSAGCIVYDTFEVQIALERAYAANQRQVEVIHVADRNTARQRAEALRAERAQATAVSP
jgi:hypothetical protein